MSSRTAKTVSAERGITIARGMMESGGNWDASKRAPRPTMGSRDFGDTALLDVPNVMGGTDVILPSIMGSPDSASLPNMMGPRGGASDIMSDRPFANATRSSSLIVNTAAERSDSRGVPAIGLAALSD
jgi:hypothetical protein